MNGFSDGGTAEPVIADPACGRLRGACENGVAVFRGVPYARPPVGALRWRPPQPPPPWRGVREAVRFGPISHQPAPAGDPGVGAEPMSEDCLSLNIWTPSPDGAAPVLVWVHGGGWITGSGSGRAYDGAALARQGLVVVTINYRLGRLGFLEHPALAAERAAGEPGGAYGLQDVMAALQWVRDHIGAFGGDAGRVCLAGQSAGGALVLRLMIAQAARGLFHAAVAQSGLGREPDRLKPWDTGPDPASTAAQLRALSAKALLRPRPDFYGGELGLRDGVLVDAAVMDAFRRGRQARVPLIIGANGAEFPDVSGEALTPVREFRAALTEADKAVLGPGTLASDLVFHEPALQLAQLHARAGAAAWLYRFNAVPAGLRARAGGAPHAIERHFLFDSFAAAPWASDAADHRMAGLIGGYWSRFAATGDPNGGAAPSWEPATAESERLMGFDADGAAMMRIPHLERLKRIGVIHDRAAGA